MSTRLYVLSTKVVATRKAAARSADVEISIDEEKVRRLARRALRNKTLFARGGALTAKVVRGTLREGD